MNHLKLFCFPLFFSIFAALILTAPTFYNDLPLMYYDSAYFATLGVFSYSPEVYFWRPLTYSFFLRGCFWFFKSLVFPIFAQNFFLFLGLSLMGRTVLKSFSILRMLGLLFVLLLTPFINISNFLISDVFAGLIPLSFGIIYINTAKKNITSWIALIFSIAIHYINLVIGVFLFPWLLLKVRKTLRSVVVGLALVPVVLIATTNFVQSEKLFISNTTEIFLFSRLAAMGLVDDYLHKECPNKNYIICKHLESGFHIWKWGPESLIGKVGGIHKIESEIITINRDILLSEKIFVYLEKGLYASLQQFFMLASPMPPVFGDAEIYKRLDQISLKLGQQYKSQPIESLNLELIYNIHGYIELLLFLISMSYLIYSFRKKTINIYVRSSVLSLFIVYTLNALICGFMTDPMARYSDRILWILPVLAWIQFCCDREPAATAERVGGNL